MQITPEQVAERMGCPYNSEIPISLNTSGPWLWLAYQKSCERIAELENLIQKTKEEISE